LWTKNRGVYSNVLGYFGGVAYAILVAKICMIFPNLAPNKLLYNFFRFYSEWEWNSENPIYLCEIKNNEQSVNFNIDSDLFYKKGDQGSLMPIITPAFPS
jgi:poly(A) polymerase